MKAFDGGIIMIAVSETLATRAVPDRGIVENSDKLKQRLPVAFLGQGLTNIEDIRKQTGFLKDSYINHTNMS